MALVPLFSQTLLFLPLGCLSLLGLLAVMGVSLHWLPTLTASAEPPLDLLRAAVRRALAKLPATLAACLAALLAGALPYTLPLLLCLGFSVPSLCAGFARTDWLEED